MVLARFLSPLVALSAFAMCGGSDTGAAPSPTPQPGGPAGQWQLSWRDEFDGPDGSRPDPSRWVYELGGGGWGNQELETYTDRAENARIEGGALVITARAEKLTGSDGIARDYTSARLKTLGRFSQAYGRFEARIRIPRGQGLWPAFWMMGVNIDSRGWPDDGEIDVMENIGREPTTVHGTLHGPGHSGAGALGMPFQSPDGRPFADDYHRLRDRVGAVRNPMVRGQPSVPDAETRRFAHRRPLGVRSRDVHAAQRRGGRGLARKSGSDDRLPATDAGGLRTSVSTLIRLPAKVGPELKLGHARRPQLGHQARAASRTISNTAPAPGSLDTEICPPWPSTMALTIERPSPLPRPSPCARDASAL